MTQSLLRRLAPGHGAPAELGAASGFRSPRLRARARQTRYAAAVSEADEKRPALEEPWRAGKQAAEGLDHLQSTRLLAVLNVALADASISAWHVKLTHWTVRPVTVLRERRDPEWLPHLLTPSFPSYVSAHATVSGAATEVLAAFFPDRADALRAMAGEAAMSRLYGGIHYRSDNDEGLELDRRIGRLGLERLFGPDVTEPLNASLIRPLLP